MRKYLPQALTVAFFAVIIIATTIGVLMTKDGDVSNSCDRFSGTQFDLCIEAQSDRRP